MDMLRPLGSLLASLSLATACGVKPSDADSADAKPTRPSPTPADAANRAPSASPPDSRADLHEVKCGCALSDVGTCGEFVEIDGSYVPLELPASSDLGPMPFCGKDDLRARVEGRVQDGRFVATSFELEPPKPQ